MRQPLPLLCAAILTLSSSSLRAAEGAEAVTTSIPGRLCGSRWVQAARAAGHLPHLPQRDPGAAERPVGVARDSIQVGTELAFPVFTQLVTATCRFAGEEVFVFVENRQWDTEGGSILQSHVDALAELFERATPADPSRGIYDISVEAFGAPPDVDGYDPVFLLITQAPFAGLIGWFDREVADHAIPEFRRDIIHLDERAVRRESYLARGTLAHEFQHLIHWNHDMDEEAWVDEGLAGYAEELVGYPEADPAAVPAYLATPGTPLTQFPLSSAPPRYYGATYLYMSYLAERFGADFIRDLVGEARNGIFGVEAALTESGHDVDFESTWADWILANITGGEFGYDYRALGGRRTGSLAVVSALPLVGANASISQWATSNIMLRTAGNVAIDFDGDDAGRYRVWSLAFRDGTSQVEEVNLDGANQGRSLNAGVDSVLFVTGRTSVGGGNYELDGREFVPTAIAASGSTLPAGSQLGSAYPNPFNSSVQIPVRIGVGTTTARLEIVDVLGQQVWHRDLPVVTAAELTLTWQGNDAAGHPGATGVYQVRLRTQEGLQTQSILLLR